MRGFLWLLLLNLFMALDVSAGVRLAAHVDRIKSAWKAAEKAGNISSARILVHFTQARKSASKLFIRAASSGDTDTMELLMDIPLLDFNLALEIAAQEGQEAAIDFIIRHAQMNDEIELNLNNALAAAGIRGKTPVQTVGFLLAHGATDIDYLLLAATQKSPETLQAYWDSRKNLNSEDMLLIAAAAADDDIALANVRYFVEQHNALSVSRARRIARQHNNPKTVEYLGRF